MEIPHKSVVWRKGDLGMPFAQRKKSVMKAHLLWLIVGVIGALFLVPNAQAGPVSACVATANPAFTCDFFESEKGESSTLVVMPGVLFRQTTLVLVENLKNTNDITTWSDLLLFGTNTQSQPTATFISDSDPSFLTIAQGVVNGNYPSWSPSQPFAPLSETALSFGNDDTDVTQVLTPISDGTPSCLQCQSVLINFHSDAAPANSDGDVPEPATSTLLLLGLIAIAAATRKCPVAR